MRKRNGNLGSLVCSNTQSPLGAGPGSAHPSRSSLMASGPNDRASPLGRRGRELIRHTDQRSHQLKPVKMDGFAENSGPTAPRILGSTSSTRIRPGPDLPNKRFQRGREIGPTSHLNSIWYRAGGFERLAEVVG